MARKNGERGWDRTIDHLINVPLRLSPPLASLQSGLSLHRGFRFRWAPSSLYTFPSLGLARGCRHHDVDEFSDFDAIPSAVSLPMAPAEVKCSTTELRALSSPVFFTPVCDQSAIGNVWQQSF